MFAVQDEITEAIVAAIEPQLYAAENFRAQRKPPDSMDAWDLVMRALSHYWRVTRQDNVVAQALLEKAIAIDPNYGQALGVLAASHTFSAHMGWADMATGRADRRARGAGGDPGRQRGSLGALRAWAAFICSRGVSTIRWPSSSWRCGSIRISRWRRAITAWRCPIAAAGRRPTAASRALRLSPRDPFSAVYYGIAAYAQFVGRNYDEAMRLAREGIRQRGDFVGAHRVLTAAAGMAGKTEVAAAALQELRRAQPNISLAWIANANADQGGRGDASTIWKASAAPAFE